MIVSERLKSLILCREATDKDLAGIDPEEVRALKSDPDNAQFKAIATDTISHDAANRRIKFVWTDQSIDADGDKIMASGWQFDRFKENPVILWSHIRKEVPPVAKAVSIGIEEGPNGPRGVLVAEFAQKEVHEFADTIYQLVANDFLRGMSAGFRIMETAKLTAEQAKAEGLGPMGIKATKQMLHENSVVTLPSNGNALAAGLKSLVERGVVKDQTARSFEKTYPLTERDWQARQKELARSFVAFSSTNNDLATPLDQPMAVTVGNEVLVKALADLTLAVTKNIDATRALLQHASDLTKGYVLSRSDAGGQRPDAGTSIEQAVPIDPNKAADAFLRAAKRKDAK